MISWLYGLLLGLGISSLILILPVLLFGIYLKIKAFDASWKEDERLFSIWGTVLFFLIPFLVTIGIVLLSVTLNVGKI